MEHMRSPNPAPNVAIIIFDDLGLGDVSAYNDHGRIRTPHMDALARQGLRFTDAHASSSNCSPSRYALLTGRYHWRTTLQSGIVAGWDAPPLIPSTRMTIASLARSWGYRTACVGKCADAPSEPRRMARRACVPRSNVYDS
jgi:arylsulfatase A